MIAGFQALLALVFAQLLPGLLAAKLLDLGRSREERWLMAIVLGGPIGALFHLGSLLLDLPVLFWPLVCLSSLCALFVRPRSRLGFSWPRSSVAALAGIVAFALLPYLLTTGSSYRVDERGELTFDRALQRDTLFHLGVARSLESSYPPRLLSAGGEPIGYHSGYHLQIALWSRYFGLDPLDGLIRLGPVLYIALYILTAYLLARRLTESERARLLASILVLGSGFGFAFFFRPSVDWWSLTFMDWGVVSIFLSNPLLPALPLLFTGLALLNDSVETGARGALAAGVIALAFLFEVKVFLGAQVVAAMGIALLGLGHVRRGRNAVATTAIASVPVVLHTLFAAAASNTSIGLRPLEIVRYSMEKLGWPGAVEALARVGALEAPASWLPVAAAVFLWCAGFLGLRLLALPWVVRSLGSLSFLPAVLSAFALVGFPLALVFRVAPAEAQGLSRLEALNDVGWFATASGIVLWFPTAMTLSRWRPLTAVSALLLLAFPATAQHFLYAGSLAPDRIGEERLEAAFEAKRISPPGSVWLDPPDRARPSLLPYLAGRAVVHDPYVGYEYMFVGRDELDLRRHGLSQFWASSDPAYLAWLLDRFGVDFVWREGRATPEAATGFLESVFANGEVELLKARPEAIREGLRREIVTPMDIQVGGRGQPYWDDGWIRPPGEPRRLLSPDRTARLYLPLERDRPVTLRLHVEVPHDGGELAVDGQRLALERDAAILPIPLPPRRTRGLHVVELAWRARTPLAVSGLAIDRGRVKEP